jgi:ribose 5-phosphate isomerase B
VWFVDDIRGHRLSRSIDRPRFWPTARVAIICYNAPVKIALCSDEPYPVHEVLLAELRARAHEVVPFGAVASGRAEPWVTVAEQAAQAVARGDCQEGVFACWSGTGIAMAANKLAGIRAALCTDPGTVRAARIWNDANVLCLSNRLLSSDMAREMLAAWFEPYDASQGRAGVADLAALDARYRK